MEFRHHTWDVQCERGPDWVFAHLSPAEQSTSGGGTSVATVPLSEELWRLLNSHLAHRLVIEMDDVSLLHSELIGELVLLHKRIHSQGGIMRLAGLSARNQEVLHTTRLDDRFPQYANRSEAVLGCKPSQPR